MTFGLFIALATTALTLDDCIFINFGDEDDEDRESQTRDATPPLGAVPTG
ncbi:hypothetical protein [Nannocystis punicea]|uniref:Uncharacterized protein n=1 Tax=Nannocystis punicea TaxID=2995304 RepID=A0ABY7GTC4_9BACT|nr:hypothetical protein [Nannocystis poenicansa]WAS90198.1 hypothetical protein O0S08_28725 [Nannocystis poenicansa]